MVEKVAFTRSFLQFILGEYETLKAENEALRSEVNKTSGEKTQKA